MNLNKFTLKSLEALEKAQNRAFKYNYPQIERLIQREIENNLASELLTKQLPEKVTVDFDGKKVVFIEA